MMRANALATLIFTGTLLRLVSPDPIFISVSEVAFC